MHSHRFPFRISWINTNQSSLYEWHILSAYTNVNVDIDEPYLFNKSMNKMGTNHNSMENVKIHSRIEAMKKTCTVQPHRSQIWRKISRGFYVHKSCLIRYIFCLSRCFFESILNSEKAFCYYLSYSRSSSFKIDAIHLVVHCFYIEILIDSPIFMLFDMRYNATNLDIEWNVNIA